MNAEETFEVITKLEEEGRTLEEIYIEYSNKLSKEYEKPREKQNLEEADKYRAIKQKVAVFIANEVMRERGYKTERGTKHYHWVKVVGFIEES